MLAPLPPLYMFIHIDTYISLKYDSWRKTHWRHHASVWYLPDLSHSDFCLIKETMREGLDVWQEALCESSVDKGAICCGYVSKRMLEFRSGYTFRNAAEAGGRDPTTYMEPCVKYLGKDVAKAAWHQEEPRMQSKMLAAKKQSFQGQSLQGQECSQHFGKDIEKAAWH